MKAVMLAGGLSTRLAEETVLRPKPMVEIGGKSIRWHIMRCLCPFRHHRFLNCVGYKDYMVKEFVANLALHTSDVTIDLANTGVELLQNQPAPWSIALGDTDKRTQTGARLRRITLLCR